MDFWVVMEGVGDTERSFMSFASGHCWANVGENFGPMAQSSGLYVQLLRYGERIDENWCSLTSV